MAGKIYVVGTPIGNLSDLSPRAAEVLSGVDFIAAEDTRVTAKLLNRFGIKKETVSYYEHNKAQKGEYLISRVLAGEDLAIVSDAGMPAISDPGEDIVRQAHENGITVESVPGPSALISALSISGFPSGRFCFEGFLSVNRISRTKHLEELKGETRTMIFYEAPHKLLRTLGDMLAAFGEREICIVKELTKIHETVYHFTFTSAIEFFEADPPKGEYVVIIKGADKEKEKNALTLTEAQNLAQKLMSEGMSASSAAKEAAAASGFKKGEIYKAII
ncbi:MAG: 16S rRNA (cytidine(1402)-2'-O)-methyltransferase [Clostridia bacterium]|nr:16S rRNA (cytidine(1402)-2'-O)-methyltransferase [Clostridia bacterium]